MRKASFCAVLFSVCTVIFWTSIPTGCANIIPPGGGPRDSTAPVLLSVAPKDSTLNFKGARITFTFDEFIDDPQDIQNNLLFTPTFEVNPELTIRAKTMTLRLRDSLLPNTTYTFNFGNAIRDINENNVLRNFVYT
ncbi:MAG TPA: Ig-like domain-containing protein, partial [Flavisolibacter sp.]|nr:Ig-like domain-containing protein [Flavisolibacter sp.]